LSEPLVVGSSRQNRSSMPKKGGKKGKGKKKEMLTSEADLKHFEVRVNDIIQTPLGVLANVIGMDKESGVLWLRWPSDIESPMPPKCQSKAEMEAFGYVRKPDSAHIQRSLDERTEKVYQHKFYGGLMPKTAAMKLPPFPPNVDIQWPEGTPKPPPGKA